MANSAFEKAIAENGAAWTGSRETPGDGPRPLPEISKATPQMNENLLPEAWRPWIADTAERLQCPPDYSAIAALVAAATLIGNRIRMRPKVHDPWLVVPNLWGAIVGVPGVLKTPAVNEGMLFFREIADAERAKFERRKKDADFDKEFNAAQKADLSKKMRSARPGTRDDFRKQFEMLDVDPPVEKRLWTTDVTVEKLGELLNENEDGLLLNRDELTGWFKVLDRSGHEQDRAFYLETWNGEGAFVFDRIGRGNTHIKNLTLSILGTIQPAMISPYLRGSIDGGSDDGLIQRFQALVYPETPKTYVYVDRPPVGRDAARASFQQLYKSSPIDIGARVLTAEAGGHAFLSYDPEAQEFFQAWLERLELSLRSDTFDTSALESHLAKYRSLMPTLSLIFHLLDRSTGRISSNDVGLKYAQLAVDWCGYLQMHAEKLYSMAVMSEFDVAREILARIHNRQVMKTFTARDIYGKHWKRLSVPEDVKKGLDVLVDYDYLSSIQLDTGGRGKITYIVHDSILAT